MDKYILAAASKAAGCLTEEEFSRSDLDPWCRICRNPEHTGHRDPFIGNGLIGIRVPMEGEPSAYPRFAATKCATGGTQMHGIWDVDTLIPVFNFMALELKFGRQVFRRGNGAILNYSQTLDWKTATVTTECDWILWGGSIHIVTKIWLSRAVKNLGCVEMSITPDFCGNFTITDKVDGSFIPGLEEVEAFFRRPVDTVKTIFGICGARKRQLAAATAVSVDGVMTLGSTILRKAGFEREIYKKLNAGQACKIVKFGALFSDGQANDPINAAAVTATSALQYPERTRKLHEDAWSKLWESDIEVGHPGVQMLTRNSLYQLYSNIGEDTNAVPGPTGLTGTGWGGHIFHDAEIWTYPPILLLQPELARNYVNYRFNTLPGARRNAESKGLTGAEFAWESAEFGDETIPDLPYSMQRHINSDVALAQWQYFLVTGDEHFLRNHGAEVIISSADYWVSRCVYNSEYDRYEIRQVCCADEFALIKDNNAMTNYSAKFNLELAALIAEKLNIPANPEWEKIAAKIWIPFDAGKQLILEHEGYIGEMIKQADASLLIYPWEMPMSQEVKINTLTYYRARYPSEKIMMGTPIDGIIDAELGDTESSWKMFLELVPYFRGNFLMVSESMLNETISFLTGLGGLLQLVIMGWGGVRIRNNELAFKPSVPQAVKFLKIKGLHYGGKKYDLVIENGKGTLVPKTE